MPSEGITSRGLTLARDHWNTNAFAPHAIDTSRADRVGSVVFPGRCPSQRTRLTAVLKTVLISREFQRNIDSHEGQVGDFLRSDSFEEHAVGKLLRMGAVVVGVGLIFSAPDYFAKERNAADQATMKEINQLCRSTLTPFVRNSPVNTLSKQTMDNIELARGSYCSSSRAKGFDAMSLYNLFGSVSRAGVCRVTKASERCFQYLHQRVATRQQLLPPDFETRINELFKKMKVAC